MWGGVARPNGVRGCLKLHQYRVCEADRYLVLGKALIMEAQAGVNKGMAPDDIRGWGEELRGHLFRQKGPDKYTDLYIQVIGP